MTRGNNETQATPELRPEDRIRIVLKGLSGQLPVSELCQREQIPMRLYYAWCLAFIEAGKRGLTEGATLCRETKQARRFAASNAMASAMAAGSAA